MITQSIEIADYAFLALSCFFVILGLFRGASGVFSFVAATVVSIAFSIFIWTYITGFFESQWVRVTLLIILGLLAFGFVRVIVDGLVTALLAQPADSIFGVILGIALGALVIYIAANIPKARDVSVIARESYELIKAGGYDR